MKNITTVKSLLIAFSLFMLMCTANAQISKRFPYASSFLVDVRTPKEYAQGSAPNAVNIPLGTIKHNLDSFKDKTQVVVFCHSGIRAMFAKAILMRNGIKPVVNGGTKPRVIRKIKNQHLS